MGVEGKVNTPYGEFTDQKVFSVTITYDVLKDEFNVQGLDVPVWVALGLLEYAGVVFRRRDAEAAMLAALQRRPRVSLPGDLH
jgi:hypothetical protein